MQGVQTDHPPGAVVFISGEQPRFGLSLLALEMLKVPGGSAIAWEMGVMVTRSLQNAFTVAMANPDFQWVWLMGDDHTYAPDTLMRLLDRNEPVVGGIVLNRAPPFNTTVHVHEEGRGRVKLLHEMPTDTGTLYTLAENESCGDAGLLIRREVLEATCVGGRWFDYWVSGALSAEDQQFTRRMGKHGYPVKLDLSVPIGHMTPFDIQPVLKENEDGSKQWEVRLVAGKQHVCDMQMVEEPRSKPLPELATVAAE